MTATAEPGTVERLRAWAKGSPPLEASVELLIRAFDGRFARASQPWIRVEPDEATWLDDQFLASSLGGLSGGERRVLSILVALANTTGDHHLDRADIVAGIDRDNLDLVLSALAHAGGSHQHSRLTPTNDASGYRVERSRSLHPWPVAPPPTGTDTGITRNADVRAGVHRQWRGSRPALVGRVERAPTAGLAERQRGEGVSASGLDVLLTTAAPRPTT